MATSSLELRPTSISEWNAEDELDAHLAGGTAKRASDAEALEMLDAQRFDLPEAMDWVDLLDYAEGHKTPLGPSIPPDAKNYSYYLIAIPLTIVVTGTRRLVRLRLRLELQSHGKMSQLAVAYDLFPTQQIDLKEILKGEVLLDVSKGLKYVLTAVGAGVAAPVTEALGFKLSMPFQWTSKSVTLQSTSQMANPVEWYVRDSAIEKGFTGHVIIRATKNAVVTVKAALACELHWTGLLGVFYKAHFELPEPRTYLVGKKV